MHRVLVTSLAAAAMALPTTALAAPASLPPVKHTLTAKKAGSGTCATQRRSSARGISRTTYRAPMSGFITAKLDGPRRSDWDLAIYDAANNARLATSEAFGSQELAQTWVTAGQRLIAQGCLRSGKPRSAQLSIRFLDIKPPKTDGVAKLMTVNYRDGKQLTQMENLGLDVTHDVHPGWAQVAVYSAKQLALLNDFASKAGLKTSIKIDDLTADAAKARAADIRYSESTAQSPLPSGRTEYRVLSDYQNELKKIVADYGGGTDLARPITIGKTVEGREIQGVELGKNVSNNDGRPTYVVIGMHHAREWPSAEAAMEFAWMLVKGYGSDPRITGLLERERVFVIPIDNVDGFVISRTDSQFSPNDQGNANGIFTPGEDPGETVHTGEAVAPGGPPAAYRRKNCTGNFPAGFPCEFQHGVDPNRNYGNGWGGPGASTDPSSQTYRGSGPWSEPETHAFWHFSQKHNVTSLITLHNVAALVLRPPGLSSAGFAPDEPAMKKLGDAMADATGYTSQFSWQLYDTSGTTEDWNYAAAGTFGYTIEIGPEGGQFHLPYQDGVVNEWTGNGKRPGLREALMLGAEAGADPANIATITGSAPSGRVLRLHKTFKTSTAPICGFSDPSILSGICENQGDAETVNDQLDYTMTVPSSGTYSWGVGPSTRPFVAEKWELGDLQKLNEKKWDGTMPPDKNQDVLIPFSFSDADAAAAFKTDILLEYDPGNAADLDLYIEWKDPVTGEWRTVASSAGPAGQSEEATMIQPRPGDYQIRIVNFLAPPATPYHVTLTNSSGSIKVTKSGITEAYRMSCETPEGQVLEAKDVTIGRGQQQNVDFTSCGSAAGSGTGDSGYVLGTKKRNGRLVISGRKVRLTKRGVARIRVLCPRASDGCTGVLVLRSSKRVKLGSKRFALKPGQRAVLGVRTNRTARSALARRRSMRVVANAGASKKRLTIVRARKTRKEATGNR
jgi:hypothetical protein